MKDGLRTLAFSILLVLVIFALASCMTNRKGELTTKGINFIALHCKGFDSTITNTEVIFKDTTVYIDRMGEPIYLKSPCDSVAPIIKVKDGIKSTVLSIGKSKVFICEADSLKAVVKLMERKLTVKNNTKTVIKEPCDKEHISGTQWMFIRLGQILSSFILFQVLIRWLSIYPVLKWIKILYVFKF